jgi:ElaB/YqjD/DUF883 family membrane-anchored ribosome-binding protein
MSGDDDTGGAAPDERRSEAAKRAHQAIDAAREFVGGADLDQLRAKATDAATSLYREGRDRLANSPEIAKATGELRESIRKNPLAAIGIAFTAGLLIALITRG